MTSNLQQLQLTFDKVQDRLVLTLFTQDFLEYRFWLTRRLTKALWEILLKLLNSDQKNNLQKNQEQKQIADQIEKEKQQRQPIAEKYGTPMTKKPFGEEPLLIFKIVAKQGDKGHSLLHFEDAKGHSIEFGGDSRIIMALCQLIQRTAEQADWGLIFTKE